MATAVLFVVILYLLQSGALTLLLEVGGLWNVPVPRASLFHNPSVFICPS